jgi:hypothetical protein
MNVSSAKNVCTTARPSYGKVIAAIADGCVDCAARGEAITEVMRVHQRVLRTLRPMLITSHEGQTACPVAVGHIGGQLGRDLSGH